MMFNQSITRLRAPLLEGRLGSKTRDWPNAAEVVFTGVAVQPRSSREADTEPRDQVISGWRVYSRAGVDLDVLPSDRVRIDTGAVCEVIGEIARWPHPIKPGAVHHVEFDLQRVTG
jgi:hypothetical protein